MNGESVNRVLLNKIFNFLKRDILFDDGKLVFNIYDNRQGKLTIHKGSGINVLLKNGGYINDYIIEYLMYHYGLNKEECEILWREISLYLKKENYDSFKKFVKYHAHSFNDPYNDETIDYLSMMDEEDYRGVYNYIIYTIEQNL